jgi:outer membrane lipoprotein-sorting protein
MLVPFQTEAEGMAPVPLTMKVEEVKINTGLEDELFKVEE